MTPETHTKQLAVCMHCKLTGCRACLRHGWFTLLWAVPLPRVRAGTRGCDEPYMLHISLLLVPALNWTTTAPTRSVLAGLSLSVSRPRSPASPHCTPPVHQHSRPRCTRPPGGLLDLPIRVVVDPASGHYIELPSGSRGTSSDGRPLHQQHQYHQQQRRQQDRHDGARQRPGPGPGSGGSGSSDGTGVSPRGNATELPPGPTLARGTPPDAGDDDSGASQPLPQQQQQQQQLHIWVYLDAVDGTVKLAGLGNEPSRLRVINDSTWAVGIAMTDPTRAGLDELRLRDFKIAAIVDGSFGPSGRAAGGSGARGLGQADGRIHGAAWQAPHSEISYPAEVIACWQDDVPAPAGSGGDSPTGWCVAGWAAAGWGLATLRPGRLATLLHEGLDGHVQRSCGV